MKCSNRVVFYLIALAGLAAALVQAGPLDPPAGPVTSTYKTLHEVEPRIPINSANTPGDFESVFRIGHSGSYYLTGDITGVAAKHGIKIEPTDGGPVTIDFRGHQLVGVAGSLNGITFGNSDMFAVGGPIYCKSGSIRGWGGDGVHLPGKRSVIIEEMSVGECGNDGIQVDIGARIVRCTISTNIAHGVNAAAGTGTLIEQTGVADNGGSGVVLGELSVVRDCGVFDNMGGGIVSTGTHNEITGCQLLRNIGAAYIAGNGDTARRNTMSVGGDIRPVLVSLPSHTTFEENRLAITIGQVSAACLDVTGSGNSISGNRFVGANTFVGPWLAVRVGGAGNTFRSNEVALGASVTLSIQGSSNAVSDNTLPLLPAGAIGIRVETSATGSTIEHNRISGTGVGAFTAIQLFSGNNLCVRNDISRVQGGSAIDNQGPQNAIGPTVTAAQMAANTNPGANFVH